MKWVQANFSSQDIETLLAFIQFRQRHILLTEEDLEIIIASKRLAYDACPFYRYIW